MMVRYASWRKPRHQYSRPLTVIVLASIPVYVVLSLLFTPVLRACLNEKFNRGAENQSFLVETISGIDTVKAMAVEPRWQQKWDKQLAGYVSAGLSTTQRLLQLGVRQPVPLAQQHELEHAQG